MDFLYTLYKYMRMIQIIDLDTLLDILKNYMSFKFILDYQKLLLAVLKSCNCIEPILTFKVDQDLKLIGLYVP